MTHTPQPTTVRSWSIAKRGQRLSEPGVVFSALCVALVAAAAIGALQHWSNLNHEERVEIAQMRCLAIEIDDARQRALAQTSPVKAAVGRISALRADVDQSFASLKKLPVPRSSIWIIYGAYDRYREALTQELALVQAGRAREVARRERGTALAFSELLGALDEANTESDIAAATGDIVMYSGAFVVLILAFVIVSFIFRRFARVEHDSTLMTMEAQQRGLRFSEERFRALVSSTNDIIAIIKPDGAMRYISPAGEELWKPYSTGFGSAGAIENVAHPDDRERLRAILRHITLNPGEVSRDEIRLYSPRDGYHHYEIILVNRLSMRGVDGIVVTCHDIAERKDLVDRLSHQAFHDVLTGLPNRAHLMRRLDRTVRRAAKENTVLALLFIDLDNFKVINDSLGHQAGDSLLRIIAERLAACARETDLIARLGGDEFTILMENIDSDQDAVAAAEKLRDLVTQPVLLSDREIAPSLSIGIVMSYGGRDMPEDLLKNADTAMYHAKVAGKGQHCIFDTEMKQLAMDRLELESGLRTALEMGELRVLFQPIVQLQSGCITEIEALARWQHPARGLLSPNTFIPIAEETNLIVPLGEWVMREACLHARMWQQLNPSLDNLVIGANLSGKQLANPGLVEKVHDILRETKLPPGSLKLEITETEMMQDVPLTIQRLRELRQLGVRIAVDDFGTGYSSMCYLSDFPIDTLKIDRAFVQRIDQSRDDQAIVEAVINLGRNLSLRVTGEGIETEQQLRILQRMQCDSGQGFLFATPLEPAQMTQFLRSQGGLRQLILSGVNTNLPKAA